MPRRPWPWPADSALDRARRVAQSYRSAVEMHMPDLCARIDEHMVELGQGWVRPQVAQYEPDDLLTPFEVTEFCHIERDTLLKWRARGLKVTETVDGDRYRFADLLEYQASRRQKRVNSVN